MAIEPEPRLRFNVGQRVTLRGSNRIGTVRFLGPLEGTAAGEWAGLDFDDGAGKHDGSRAGVRYFSCANGPTSGSFVRPALLSAGVSAHAAFVSRYAAEAGPSSYGSGFGKRIEAVGLESVANRVGQLSTLRIISLSHEDVHGVGSEQDAELLRRDAAGVHTLDLSSSLIASWAGLAAVVDAMPHLKSLVARCGKPLRRGLTLAATIASALRRLNSHPCSPSRDYASSISIGAAWPGPMCALCPSERADHPGCRAGKLAYGARAAASGGERYQ